MDSERPRYTNPEVERIVLSHFIRFDPTLSIRLDYFTIEEARQLFRFVQKHRGLASSFDEWWELWKVELQRTHKTLEPHRRFLQTIWAEEREDDARVAFFVEQLKGFAEGREVYDVMDSAISLYQRGEVTDARQKLEDGVSRLRSDFSPEVLDRGDFVETFLDRFHIYQKRKRGEEMALIPTGIQKLDRRIDGSAPASLNFFQGETGSGKTFLLMEVALQHFLQLHRRAIFVSVEMQKSEIEVRWDGRIIGTDYLKVGKGHLAKVEERWWRKRIRDLQKATFEGGRLATAFIPEGCTVASLETELDYWEQKWGAPVDTLCVDYADLMESRRRSYSEQQDIGGVFRDLKRLSQVRNLVIWTGSQFSMKSYGKRIINVGDTGYSMKKGHWSNLIIGIGGDPADKEEGVMRLYVTKNTFGPSGMEVVLHPDFPRSLVDVPIERRRRNGQGTKRKSERQSEALNRGEEKRNDRRTKRGRGRKHTAIQRSRSGKETKSHQTPTRHSGDEGVS